MRGDQLVGPTKVDLRKRRINAGHSIRSLARTIDVSKEAIRRSESGEAITPASAFEIAKFHGLEISDVWDLDKLEAAA